MKLVVLTDIHGDIGLLSDVERDLKDADLILLSGDITHFGRTSQIKRIIEKFRAFNKNIMAIPGNCDYNEVNNYLADMNYSLDCRYVIRDSLYLMGVGGSLPCPGMTPLEYSEEDFATMLEETVSQNIDALPIILLSHQPPFNTINDKLSDGFHVGSHSVRHFIEKYQPLICFCGHIHEGTGIDKIGKTFVVNTGPFRMGRYSRAIVQKGET